MSKSKWKRNKNQNVSLGVCGFTRSRTKVINNNTTTSNNELYWYSLILIVILTIFLTVNK